MSDTGTCYIGSVNIQQIKDSISERVSTHPDQGRVFSVRFWYKGEEVTEGLTADVCIRFPEKCLQSRQSESNIGSDF